jgi:hypothetical protein
MAISIANKKIELYYWIGDNANYDPDDSGTVNRWLRANTSAGKNAVVSVDYEHSLGKPAVAKVTLQNGVPNFKAADADSYSSVFSSLLAADDSGTASPVFTDFMRVKLVDINTKLILLYGRIYDIDNEYNSFEGNVCKLVIKDELEVLRGMYSSDLPDEAYTGGSTKRSAMIKTQILANAVWNTPAADKIQIDTDDGDRFEDSISEYGTTGVLKLSKSQNNLLNEISNIARADPNDITNGDDSRAKAFGYDYYLDANQTGMGTTSINSVLYDTTAPANAHLNYFKRGSRTTTNPTTYGLTVELPTAAFTPTGQKLAMTQDFAFERPKHEIYSEAQVTGIFNGNLRETKTFETIIVSNMSSGHEFTYENLAFSDEFAGGERADIDNANSAESLTSEILEEWTADGTSRNHTNVCKVQYQSDTGTGSKYLLISDLTADFPTGATQVMLKGASSSRTCLFTPKTGRLRNRVGIKRTFKTQWGLDSGPASAADNGAVYDRLREKLAALLSRAGGTGNEIIRGSFSVTQYPSYYKDFTPTGTSSTVCNTSVNPETFGIKKGMPVGILHSGGKYIEYHSYASATGSSSITVGDAPTKSDPTATHGWTASTSTFSTGNVARVHVPIRAGDLIKVVNKIENINTNMLVTNVSYMEGPGVQNARLEVVGEQAAQAGRVPKTTSSNMSQNFGNESESIPQGNYPVNFTKDGSNSMVEFTAATRNTVTWTAGLLNIEDGRPLETNVNSFAISAGATGTMANYNTSSASTRADTTYVVYLDTVVSKTALQTINQTSYATVDDSNTTIIALCRATESSSGAASLGLSEFVATNTSSTPIALGRSKVITGSQFQTGIAGDGTNSAAASSTEGRIVIKDDVIYIHDGDSTTQHFQWYVGGSKVAFIGHDRSINGMAVVNYSDLGADPGENENRNLTLWSNNGEVTLRGALGVNVVTGVLDIQKARVSADDDDPKIQFSNQALSTRRWTIGVDGSDSDKMKWDWENATVGAAERMELDSSGNLAVTGTVTSSAGVLGVGTAVLTGSTNNTVATVTGANALVGETNLTFTGSVLTVAGTVNVSDGAVDSPAIFFTNKTDTGISLSNRANDGGGDVTTAMAFHVGGEHVQLEYATDSSSYDRVMLSPGMYHDTSTSDFDGSAGHPYFYLGSHDLNGTWTARLWTAVYSYYHVAGDGTIGNPAFNFSGDSDTGFYNHSANHIGISCGNSMQGYFGSQYLYMGDAASFGGGYTWANDTNTFINNPSADHIRFSTGGGTRAEFDDTGLTLNTLASGTGTDLVHDSNLVKAKSSSKRYKKNIIDINLPTDDIYKLRPTTFTWKENEKIDFGLIAEEVEEIIPQLVTYNSDSLPQAVRYDLLSVLLLTEIKKMKEEIKELKEKK